MGRKKNHSRNSALGAGGGIVDGRGLCIQLTPRLGKRNVVSRCCMGFFLARQLLFSL